ncbi:MAG: polyprenyl synthetase family protein [Planctomycetes bacterium]|nr:polyprenyl synthetase family protein [Planctomycetota bacterium]
MSFNLKDYLAVRQALVDRELEALLAREADAPAELIDAMRYSLLAPGKRLRPVLVFMAAQAAGGAEGQAIPAACAVEMIHTYSLIHDDLPAMDDDDLRRGMPTCHKKFGEALAILAGDGLLTLAFQVLADGYPAKTAAACCLALAKGSGAAGMVGGQVDDLAWENNDRPRSVTALEHIHEFKTGALFRACLRLGVIAAQGEHTDGPVRDLLDRLDVYGRCFGLVFQITDDLIDVEGNVADSGKQVGKDAARGKLTYPGLLGVEESRARAAALTQQALEAVSPLGAAGEPLLELMRFVLARDR